MSYKHTSAIVIAKVAYNSLNEGYGGCYPFHLYLLQIIAKQLLNPITLNKCFQTDKIKY